MFNSMGYFPFVALIESISFYYEKGFIFNLIELYAVNCDVSASVTCEEPDVHIHIATIVAIST